MDPLAVVSLGPATLSALTAVRPVQALRVPAAQDGKASRSPLSVQDLAQRLFQQTLQAATLSPLAEPAAGSAGLAVEAAASLLAALNAPQATANTNPTADATTHPTAVQATGLVTAPAGTPPAAVPAELPANQDAFAASLSTDFALGTALRFGAGVSTQIAPTLATGNLGTGLVRDATAVLRLEGIQPHAGGPGPEAFTHPQAPVQEVLRTYEAVPATQGPGQVDLLA